MATDPYSEDRYPVLVSTTNYYVVWQEGADPDDAVNRLKDDPDWYEALPHSPFEADYDVELPETWQYHGTVYAERIGPLNRCRKCDGKQYHVTYRLSHNKDCPDYGDTYGD
ncbi:hypothetical protein PV336_15955 [Streptomyces sp. MI02-2A]|uniref:hypothetical protein n=1 Tax=Streptomyces sp. MI02-2A TaxID=3028688 RepID=UPI0029B44D19|nr:hypothetical protein [Streptomyces sp. MI02-2A]MDX3260714.1 hypothetical protein [Streptomyces sp. MI02-2A]